MENGRVGCIEEIACEAKRERGRAQGNRPLVDLDSEGAYPGS